MSALLGEPPFAPRDDDTLLSELTALTRFHLAGCSAFRAMWPEWQEPQTLADIPYTHVSVFKYRVLRTDGVGIKHQRTLLSSSTSGHAASRIALDAKSSELQSRSSSAILKDVLGGTLRPFVIVDDARHLRRPDVSARIAAAMSLRPLASSMFFLLDESGGQKTMSWDRIAQASAGQTELLVYGLTSVLYTEWARAEIPPETRAVLKRLSVRFVHSGGWKKLETLRVDRATFDAALLDTVGPRSSVVDFYGLVEQVGVLFPLCDAGHRHVPRWCAVIVRDSHTREVVAENTTGQLQLANPFAMGAPYHSVLTEDLGRIVPGRCACGREGTRFDLVGRIPSAELRGCANV